MRTCQLLGRNLLYHRQRAPLLLRVECSPTAHLPTITIASATYSIIGDASGVDGGVQPTQRCGELIGAGGSGGELRRSEPKDGEYIALLDELHLQ